MFFFILGCPWTKELLKWKLRSTSPFSQFQPNFLPGHVEKKRSQRVPFLCLLGKKGSIMATDIRKLLPYLTCGGTRIELGGNRNCWGPHNGRHLLWGRSKQHSLQKSHILLNFILFLWRRKIGPRQGLTWFYHTAAKECYEEHMSRWEEKEFSCTWKRNAMCLETLYVSSTVLGPRKTWFHLILKQT